MILAGKFVRSIDEKLRVALPKRFRDQMTTEESRDLFVTRYTDQSLAIYTPEGLEAMAQRLKTAPPMQDDVAAFQRMFFSNVEGVEVDSQGRFRIPQGHAEMANLNKDVMMIGVIDHVEIWDKQVWDTYSEKHLPNFDKLASSVFVPGTSASKG